MNRWVKKVQDISIFFVNPDVKRGIGFENLLPEYHIICTYYDPIIPFLRKQGANIFCLQENDNTTDLACFNNTGRLLENKRVISYIQKNSFRKKVNLMYFKPSVKIDLLIDKYGYNAIGNNAKLNEKFENKIKFYTFLKHHFPKNTILGETGLLSKMDYSKLSADYGFRFVIQFGHGWAGKTTFFIKNSIDLNNLKRKFPNTEVKICKEIDGFTVLNNCVIYDEKVLVSPPAIQISGFKELSGSKAVTCGRQWPVISLSNKEIKNISGISQKVGKLMKKEGFRGFFGLDFLIDCKSKKIFVSDNNARLTASASFYTKLELSADYIPLLGYHLSSFLNLNLEPGNVFSKIVGSQIIIRNKKNFISILDDIDYGIFKVNSGYIERSFKNEYFPGNLSEKEFIFMKNAVSNDKNNESEKYRIECKKKVLDSSGKLEKWIKKIIKN